ncbi:hypothetical protein SAMN05878482_101327 [Peribacillus simplex]|uniref:Uncharacterized protein n=1 Tax=Peribacillus simplex TaxID=1478 RepID=A0A9X8R263_9BACI|nr:hypothetical protein SAMN05878482_101327 [Peribacillus simplex]
MRDSCGSSGTGETKQEFTPRRLTARPSESEHLEGESTTPLYLENSNKVCENSLFLLDLRIGGDGKAVPTDDVVYKERFGNLIS